ncbi:hypothetical protein H4R99_005522 [Coemansia sp. RSA 1722]|nr:hypothetical protein LPJ57_002782 [Coemansia sp. RSA 486]KAJ2229616.1 hypothetical protein IWW45_006124 [Coemansia sp. RSA 485]KAJ2595016.1 hypothetical protein H4R99_005522 [Coemansia sp. RSA 1722]
MDHLTFAVHDENGAWARIADGFQARLPLRNLIWRGGPTQAPRFVERLEIRTTVDGSETDAQTQEDTHTDPHASGPLLHLYIVDSDTDADTYKGVVRPRAKAWVARVSQRRGASWLMIYVPGVAEMQRMSTAQGSFLSKRTTTFDRLRSDFQTRKETRVVLLRNDQVESWNAAILAVRDLTVAALEDRAAALGDEIRRMDANRLLPGWNYCGFFVLKERLIALHRLMGLRAEALAQYDELEALFFQLLDAQRLAWFAAFGGGQRGDDFTDLLHTRKKPYRALMVANDITIFDFRMYLFGCQCQLLVADELYVELAARAQRFVPALSQAMREPGTGLSAAFVAAWTYSTCQNVVEICEGAQWAGSQQLQLSASKAGFLAAARHQLDTLGALSGRLPTQETPQPDSAAATQALLSSISNPVLSEALAADERFDQIYVRACDQAAQYYAECGRRRFARQQRADVARLLEARGRWDDAVRALEPLVPAASDSLGAADVPLLARLAMCELRRSRPRACLPLLLRLLAHASLVADGARLREYAELLQTQADALSATDDQEPLHMDAAALFAVAGAVAHDCKDVLGASLSIDSKLEAPVRAARIDAVLVARSDAGRQLELRLAATNADLAPGRTSVLLTNTSTSCPGLFSVRSVTITMGGACLGTACDIAPVRLGSVSSGLQVFATGAASVSDGRPALRLCVESRSCAVDPGMAVRLFDSRGRSLLGSRTAVSEARSKEAAVLDPVAAQGVAVDPAQGAMLFADAVAPGASLAFDVTLPDAHALLSGAITVCAAFSVAGHQRFAVTSGFADFSPSLRVAARTSVLRGGRRLLQVRAQCVSTTSIQVRQMGVGPAVGSVDCAWRGFLCPGECVSGTVEIPPHVDPTALAVAVVFTSAVDAALLALDTHLSMLADVHGLAMHLPFLRELVAAHIRVSMDQRQTLATGRLVCASLQRLCTPAVCPDPEQRAQLRRLLSDLDTKFASTDICATNTSERTLAVPLPDLLKQQEQQQQEQCVSVTAGLSSGRFCHVYEPVQLTLRLDKPDNRRRVSACLALRSEDWLVSGPTRCLVDFDRLESSSDATLEFTLVPLTVGFLPMPEVVCLDDLDQNIKLQTTVAYMHSQPCVLPNPSVPTVYTVPVLVSESPVVSAFFS